MMTSQWIVYVHIGVFVLLINLLSPVNTENTQQSSNSSGITQDDGTGERSALSKGMDPLYKMTDVFLGDVVQPHRLNKYFNISRIRDDDYWSLDDWKEYADYAVGFLVCLIIGILFIVVLPIVGLLFCCCRCCGRCGGKASAHDPKRAKCKRLTYGFILAVINTLILASVVCLFCTNELLHEQFQNEGNKGAFGKMEKSVQEIQDYVDNSYEDLRTGTLGQYETKIWSPDPAPDKSQLIRNINDVAKEAVDKLAREVNATDALDKAHKLAEGVNHTLDSLNAIGSSLHNLTELGNTLKTQLQTAQTEITNHLSTEPDCIPYYCYPLKTTVSNLTLEANFTDLNKLEDITRKVLDNVDIMTYVKQAERTLDSIKANAEEKIQSHINDANDVARRTWHEIDTKLDDAKSVINQIHLKTNVQSSLTDAAKYTKDYGQYWWYGGIGISCVALLVVVFTYFGLLYGFCGERPGDDVQCCNRGLGANLLMAGVGFCFIFGWLLMLITVMLFLPGGLLYTEGCRYLNTHDPEQLKMFDPLLDLVKITGVYNDSADIKNLTLSQILKECKEDKGIYQALQLQYVIDLPKYFNPADIDSTLDEMKNADLSLNNLTIPQDLKDRIRDFGKAGFETIPIGDYRNQIQKNLTTVDLNDLARELEAVGDNIVHNISQTPSSRLPQENMNRSLYAEAANLRRIASTIVKDMKIEVATLKTAVDELDQKSNLKNYTKDLLEAINQAEDNFNTNGKDLVKGILNQEVDKIKKTISDFMGDVLNEVQNDVAKCKPVYDALYDASDAACLDILAPLNGFWFSLGWCLFFFIPSIIFAVKLAGLYRKEDEYVPGVRSRDFEDPNMELYSHGENHNDTIPLTSMDKAGRPVTNGGLPNSGYHQDDYAKKPPYGRNDGHLDNQRNYAGGDGYYPEARGHPGGGYPNHDRHAGYNGYPNGHGMSTSGYPGPPSVPPYSSH